jgi:Complex I intermediate-associated protein 30 (CIA30)
MYALNLVDTNVEKKPIIGKDSQLNYKYTFTATENETTALFADFKPHYRGRPVEAPQLNLKSIKSISIMMQSFFDKQSGPFEIIIDRIEFF